MKKMTAQKKACMIIVIIWIALGALLMTLSLTIGNSNPDTRPFLTVLRNIYITAVPVILFIEAVIRREHVVMTVVGSALVFALSLLLLW